MQTVSNYSKNSWRFPLKVAGRYLWARRGEAFITIITVISVLGVAIGVMVLNMVMSIMNGFEHELREKIVGTSSHVLVKGITGKVEGWRELRDKIAAVDGVASISPFTYHQALLRADGSAAGVLVRGLVKDTSSAEQLGSYLSAGKIDAMFTPSHVPVMEQGGSESVADLPGIVVGAELARNFGLTEGSIVSLLSPNVSSSPFGLVPKYKRFVVVGIYSSGLVEYESTLVYADLTKVQSFFRMGDSISGFEVRVKEVDQAPLIAKRIVERVGGYSAGLLAQDWTELNRPLWDALRLEKTVYFIVLLLIVVMASFSIVSTLIMIVLEKRRDIAVLRTLGASSRGISRIFQSQGAFIGGVGTILGLVAGYLGCIALREYGFPLDQKIFPVSTVPVRMDPLNFTLVGICAFTICFLATLYPARRASKLDPSEILRYE